MRTLASISAAVFFFLAPASFAQLLRVDGKEIVDAAGKPVLLRGIGLGGWLVPEGYMLHTPGYGSPTSIRNMMQDLIGEQDTKEFFRLYRANYVTAKDIEKIATWGFNSIRLPFHYELLSPQNQPGVFLEEGFLLLDSLITWSKRQGLYVILDMHCAPGGQNSNNISDSDGEAKLWTLPANQDRTVEIWKKIAERYAGEPWVAGYDLLNEPVMPGGFSNLDLRNFYRRLALAIREVDAHHILFIEGNNFATDFRDLTPPLLYGSNIVYSFHKYWNETTQATIQDYLNLRNNWNVPLWMGESGENSNPWFYETIKLLEANNIGWCWWTHKKIQTTTSPLSAPITPDYQRVLDYWNGNASRPTQAFAREALFGMAQHLALEKCEPRPDVLHALFDTDFNARSKPFAPHSLPGVIPAVAYDFGNVGIAYHDQDYKKVRWDADQPWNSGGQFRNDGVDIEKSSDAQGAAYNIGWIAGGEWLKYTVTITQAGLYDVVFRVASLNGGGALKLALDGQELIASLTIPRTGGWQNWNAVKSENLPLPAGAHVVTVLVLREGFNLNQMQFLLKSPSAVAENLDAATPQQYVLEQSFPNPIFRSTIQTDKQQRNEIAITIGYELPEKTPATLKIYDILGGEVKTLAAGAQNAGRHAFTWDGRNALGRLVEPGIYFYILHAGQQQLKRKLLLLP